MISVEERAKIIGGSDIAGVMGLSRWETPLSVWAKKTGKLKEDPMANFEQKEIGTELEEYVARKFTQKTGIKLRRDARTFRHPKYAYMVGHIDRWTVGEDSGFEAKNVGARLVKDWDDEDIPQEAVLQCVWYEGILGKSSWHIAALLGGNKFVWRKIPFDQALFDQMVETARTFMEEFVLKEIAPVAGAGDEETLAALYPESSQATVQFDGDKERVVDGLLDERSAVVSQIKALEMRKSDAESKLKQMIGESESGETGARRFSWKSQDRRRVDTEALRADDLYDKYSSTNRIRVFRELKKGGKSNGKRS